MQFGLIHSPFQLQEFSTTRMCEGEEVPVEMRQVLKEFPDVFVEPTSLLPTRDHDHCIPLKSNAVLVSIRPYRYNYFQKNKIEKHVSKMLTNGIIKPSLSVFFPALLVEKGWSWRFCIDYRKLNKITIKDKFRIPLVDDLMDELNGSYIYPKINIRVAYHQIRMRVTDIPKNAFRTHQGHYDFKVMPFGLTNASITFQSLMNHVFNPYLRKFVLMFFDDIQIYNASVQEHVIHLMRVSKLLRKEQLFAKLSLSAPLLSLK